jgi:hypothetical protein
MGFIPSIMVAVAEQVNNSAMPDTLTVYKPGPARDAQGGINDGTFPDDWIAVESDIACRFVSTQSEGNEGQIAGKIESRIKGEVIKKKGSAKPEPYYRIRYTFADETVVDFELLPEQKSSHDSAIYIGVIEAK